MESGFAEYVEGKSRDFAIPCRRRVPKSMNGNPIVLRRLKFPFAIMSCALTIELDCLSPCNVGKRSHSAVGSQFIRRLRRDPASGPIPWICNSEAVARAFDRSISVFFYKRVKRVYVSRYSTPSTFHQRKNG